MFVAFTINAILDNHTIFLFKILCWQCWKTAAVHHQKMIMLDLAPLEPVVEKASSTATSFACSSHLGGVVSKMLHWKRASCFKATNEWIRIWALLPNSVERKAGFREVSCVFLYIVFSFDVDVCSLIRLKVPLIAAVINYKFSQPNADYLQSIL